MKVREALHRRASISDAKRAHAANSKSRMKTDEQRMQDIANCLLEWESNPWDKSNISLRSLESGFLASKELVKDFSTAKKEGEQQINEYFAERKSILHTILKNKCHSFAYPPPEKGHDNKSSKKKLMQWKIKL